MHIAPTSPTAGSSPTGLSRSTSFAGEPAMLIASSRARSRPTFRCRLRPSTSWSSTSSYLIERYGKDRFFALYDAPVERVDFEKQFGRTASVLLDEWLTYVRTLPIDTAEAHTYFAQMKRLRGR